MGVNVFVYENIMVWEIFFDFKGEWFDVFVIGYGIGGILIGVGWILCWECLDICIILSELVNVVFVQSGDV